MRFLQPEALLWLLTLPIWVLIGWYALARKRAALRRFAGGREWLDRFTSEVNIHRRFAVTLLWFLALIGVIFTYARPQWGTQAEEVQQAGVDVVVLIDTSLSMAADDIAPTRLEVANHGVRELLQSLGGDRVGLVTFSGLPSLACPLTVDHGAVRLFLDALEPEVMQVPGTALADALRLGMEAFQVDEEERTSDRGRAMVLFTDGEDHEGGIEKVLPELKQRGIVVHSVGVGTTRGSPIPLEGLGDGQTGFKKDKDDRIVTTRLEEAALQQLALETGGHYYLATPAGREIGDLTSSIGEMATAELGGAVRTRFRERFQWPLGIAIVAIFVELAVGDRRRRPREVNDA